MLGGLPEELVLNILGYLTPSELVTCELVDSEWRRIALTDSLWCHLFRLAYPAAALWYQQGAEEGAKRPRVVHKELYRERAEREQREAEELERRKTTLEEPTTESHAGEASLYDSLYAAEPRPSVKAQLLLDQYNTNAHQGRFEEALENSKLALHYFERLITDADSQGADYLEWCLGLIEAQSSKGFALRQLGYLTLAVEYYRKAIRTYDEFEATLLVTAPARIVCRAKMHLVTCAKNCGVAYMLLDKPELALPMIDRIVELQQSLWDANAFAGFNLETCLTVQYLHLLACYTNRFRTLVALGNWPRAAADFAHLHGVVESHRREQEERTEQQDQLALGNVATDVWGGLRSQVANLADQQPDHHARLLAAIDQHFPHASAAARDIANR